MLGRMNAAATLMRTRLEHLRAVLDELDREYDVCSLERLDAKALAIEVVEAAIDELSAEIEDVLNGLTESPGAHVH